jgi:hypothetical protein
MEDRMKAAPGTYLARIMAALPGDSPVELFRTTTRKLEASDWDFWTADRSGWKIWIERRCPNHRLLGGGRNATMISP